MSMDFDDIMAGVQLARNIREAREAGIPARGFWLVIRDRLTPFLEGESPEERNDRIRQESVEDWLKRVFADEDTPDWLRAHAGESESVWMERVVTEYRERPTPAEEFARCVQEATDAGVPYPEFWVGIKQSLEACPSPREGEDFRDWWQRVWKERSAGISQLPPRPPNIS